MKSASAGYFHILHQMVPGCLVQ